MKDKLSLINWLLIGLVIFHLPLGHLALKGYILCIEANGRLNIESACPQPTSTTSSQFEMLETAVSDNHCGACVDLPLNLDCNENLLNNSIKKHFQHFDYTLYTYAHSQLSSNSSKHRFDSLNDTQSATSKSLSTVVLLI